MLYDPHLLAWLLEPADPAVRYRTLTELLDRPADDPEVFAARRALPQSKEATRILGYLGADGLWPHTPKHWGNMTTGYSLMGLGELGLDRSEPRVAHVAEHNLASGLPSSLPAFDVSNCFCLLNLRALVDLGYADDPRLQTLLAAFVAAQRPDGGYLCEQFARKPCDHTPKSCIKASAQALMLAASLKRRGVELPVDAPLAEYFLKRRVIYRTDDLRTVIGCATNFFPTESARVGLFSQVYALSVLGYGRRPEMGEIWALLETKRDDEGRYLGGNADQAGVPRGEGGPGQQMGDAVYVAGEEI